MTIRRLFPFAVLGALTACGSVMVACSGDDNLAVGLNDGGSDASRTDATVSDLDGSSDATPSHDGGPDSGTDSGFDAASTVDSGADGGTSDAGDSGSDADAG